jgi:Ca-activated chloride channel homolog
VAVTGPAGFRWNETAGEDGVVSGIPAPKTGEYVLKIGARVQSIGASLLSPSETSLAAVEEIEFGDRISVTAEPTMLKSDRSLWWMLAAAGFGLLLVEWWWFQRRPF